MSYAANAEAPRQGPWGGPPHQHHWYGRPPIHPGLIVLMVLGFVFWWPIGLAFLVLMLWRRNMGCWSHGSERWQYKMTRMQQKMDWMRSRMEGAWGTAPSSGNRAFDDYRTETLKRLEDEQREFREFLERLRFAKDKTEFDAFMAERRNRPAPDVPPPQG